MRKVSSYKCPECGMSYKTLSGWGEHMRRMHPETIPKGWSDARFFYYTLTGKSEGCCIQCHKPTEWNEATGKYSRYCNDPKCKQEYCKVAKKRMIDKYGKPHLLDNPEKQREMLKGKKISGEYKFSDGGKLPYVGSYERDFLMTCDVVLELSSKDIIAPSPHNYVYMYEDKPHFYIPDFYIPDFNLEIEVKDGGDNPNKHHKIQEVDKVKEKLKDQVMIGNPSVNYFKVVNKKYDDFFDFILNCKNAIDDDKLQQVQAKISSNKAPAVEGIGAPPLFIARRNAMIQADKFAAEFDSVAGPMFKRELEIAFGRYRDYSSFSHQYTYPYKYTRRSGKLIDSTYKNNENIIIEIPLMVVDTKTPRGFENDASFDDNRIIDALKNFERNITSTIKLRNVYNRYPDVSAPYVQWDGYDWMLKVTFNYSVEPANEGAYISYKDEYFNLENWKREVGHNILYITGLSGSGKSTLGYELTKTYNAVYIELDRVFGGWWIEDEKFNPNGYQGNVTKILKEIFRDENPKEHPDNNHDMSIMRARRYKKLYEYCTKHPETLFIWEGVQIFAYFDTEFLIDKPLIIKNTSLNTSFKRMSIRDRETYNPDQLANMKASYKGDEHDLESLRKFMRSKASKSKSLPAVESANSLDWIIERRMTTNDFKEIPDNSLLHLTRDAYLARVEKNPASMRNLEYYGFYNRKTNELTGILSIASDGKSKCIDLIVVDDIYRNHGIGTYMLNSAVVNHGASWLIVKTTNGPAISIYEKYGFKIVDTYKGNTGMVHRMEYHSAATESSMRSVIDEDYEAKGKKSLSSFKCVDVSPALRDKYKKDLKMVTHTYATNKTCKTVFWLDGDNLVALASVNYSDPEYNWITALEVHPDYRGYGLGKQILDYAISKMHGNALGVASDNEVAKSMYTKRGFKKFDHKKYANSTNITMALEAASSKNLPADFDKYQEIYDSLTKDEKVSYGYEVGIDKNTTYTKRIGDAYIILDSYDGKSDKWHPYPGKYVAIAAKPSVRGTGVTDKLMRYAKTDNPHDDLIAIIVKNNKHSIRLFERNGFKLDREIEGYEYYIYRATKPATEAASDESTMTKVVEFNKQMNKFKYGLAINGVIDTSRNTSGSDYDKLYHFANPAQFEKQDGGICWDFVTYEANYFKKNIPEIKFTCWYVIFNAAPNYPTHTFLTFKLGSKYILFESAFRKIKGIWEASSEKDLINFELDSMIHHGSDKGLDKAESHVFKYNALDTSLNGMTCGEFMHHIEEVGRYVTHTRSASYNVEKYTPDEVANEAVGYYGLPEDKKYPMDDPKHVLLAIKFFNYVDEDKEKLLASRINARIKEFGIHNINVGEKNRFAKYYEPVEEEVLVNWAPNVPYMTLANEGADPSVELLDDGFAYAPIKFDKDLYEKYNGTDYYPLYIILMKNISPLGSTIRAVTKEEYSHSAISFDATMEDVYTFGNSIIKKPFGKLKTFGAAHESFRKNSFKFSYPDKTEYSLYVMFFKKDEIDRIKAKVDEIFLHHDEYKYNVEGLISYIFNKPKTDPKKLFCSQFVALVINSGRNGILNKDPSMYTPVGLSTIRGVCHIENGHLRDYDQYRVEKKTHQIFESIIENKAYEALEHANIMYNA